MLKKLVKRAISGAGYDLVRKQPAELLPPPTDRAAVAHAFSEIYAANAWGVGSGVGSMPEYARPYIDFVQRFIRQNRIRSVVDFGCGDWQISQHIEWGETRYVGIDVVASVIDANTKAFSRPGISFQIAGNDFPNGDLLLCKDVLQHLPNGDVRHLLARFKERYPQMLITNDAAWRSSETMGADPATLVNADISPGMGRPIRLDMAPFNERCETVLHWEISAYGWLFAKRTCLLTQR